MGVHPMNCGRPARPSICIASIMESSPHLPLSGWYTCTRDGEGWAGAQSYIGKAIKGAVRGEILNQCHELW